MARSIRTWVKHRQRIPAHCLLNLFFAGLGVLIEKSLGRHDHAVYAKAALRRLLFYECAVCNGCGLVDCADPLEGRDRSAAHRLYRRDAGADRLPLHNYRAGAALPQAAAELRPIQRRDRRSAHTEEECRGQRPAHVPDH